MLTPCSSCRRYIRDTESACPFCAASIEKKSRLAVAVMAAAALTACQSSQPDPASSDVKPDPPTATVPADTPTDPGAVPTDPPPEQPEANNPTPEPAEPTEPTEPTPAPSTSVADNKPTPPPQVVPPTVKPGTGRPVVMRYGISPRLPPKQPNPPKK